MTWWILPLALAVGLVLGSLGGGGAILTVPILTTLVGQSAHQATASSLVIVGSSSLVGMVPHLRAGRVKVADGLVFGLLGVVGAAIGSRLSVAVPAAVLMSAFSVLLLVVAVVMWRRRRRPRSGDAGEGRGWAVRIAAASGVGLLTGFFGVGGGFVIVPALVIVLGLPMKQAVATSLLVIAVNSATSLATRAASGLELDWGLVLPFAALTVVGTLIGGRVAQRVDQRHLNLAFIVLLVLVALGVGLQNVPRLVG